MSTKKTEIPVVIDQTTGLPELPEDHAWRIGDSIIEIVKHLPAGEWGEWSDVIDRTVNPALTELDHCNWSTVQGSGIFRNKPKVVVTDWWRQRDKARDVTVFIRRYGEWAGYYMYTLIVPDRITKANIVERTTEVYREWRASVSAKQEQEEIRGLYPPNTINEKGK